MNFELYDFSFLLSPSLWEGRGGLLFPLGGPGWAPLHPSYLMQEDKEDEQRTNVFDHKYKKVEEAIVHRPPVRDLIADYTMLHIPSHKETGEEATQRQTDVGRKPVEEIEYRHPMKLCP